MKYAINMYADTDTYHYIIYQIDENNYCKSIDITFREAHRKYAEIRNSNDALVICMTHASEFFEK